LLDPLISIIVPVHNIASYLSKCLDSILNQTFTDLEVIVVNDGSTDSSGDICERYRKLDNRVKVVHSEYGGVSVARNIGLSAAKGKFIGFVDGDDYIDTFMYEKLYQLLIDTDSDISICHLARDEKPVSDNQACQFIIKEMDHLEGLRQLFKGELYRFSLCNKLFSKSCFDGVSFPVGRIHEDLSVTYQLFAKAKKSVYSNFTGYIYVKRKDSILTARYNQRRLDAFSGWKEITLFMATYYPQLLTEVNACFGYWIVDNAYYVVNQTEKKERHHFLKQIQQKTRSYYPSFLKNRKLSLKYKYLLSIMNYNIYLFILSHSIKNFFQTDNQLK